MSRLLSSFLAVIATGAVLAQPAQAQEVYAIQFAGSDGLSTFYTIDTTSGAATSIGAIGFERCGAMDVSPNGVVYAACERADGSDTPVLITIDPSTGVGTEVGPTGTSGNSADLSFRNSDGVLFLFDTDNNPEHSLFTIDTGTGAANLVGTTGLSFDGGNGMAFSRGDTLYHSARAGPDLNTLDQNTGTATLVTTLTMPGNGSSERLAAMDVNPATGVMWAVLKQEQGSGSPTDIVTVDTTTGVVTVAAATITDLDAIAWPLQNVIAVPTLSPVSLAVLVLILGLIASLFFHRRTA